MQTSIVSCALAYIRNEMVSQSGVPFGAIFSALQLISVSSMWSMKFWGSVLSFNGRRHLMYMLFIPFCVLLVGAFEPSSAISMIPRPADYHIAAATQFLELELYSTVFPDQLSAKGLSPLCNNTSDTVGDPHMTSCPSRDWTSLLVHLRQNEETFMRFGEAQTNIDIRDQNSTRSMNVNSPDPSYSILYGRNSTTTGIDSYLPSGHNSMTIASLQSWLIASSMQARVIEWWTANLWSLLPRGDTHILSHVLDTKQAKVISTCDYFYAEPNNIELISIGRTRSQNLS